MKSDRDTFIDHWEGTLGREGAEAAWEKKCAWEGAKAPGMIADMQPWDAYVSPASGKIITSKKERREDMARTNSRPWEGMASEQGEAKRRAQYVEQKQDARLHEAVSRAFYQMDPAKRRILMKGKV